MFSKNIVKHFVRGISVSSTLHQQPKSLVRFKKLQAEYQCDDGKLIWEKRGLCDKILYSTTIILCYVGVAAVLGLIYDLAKPASWKTRTC